MTSISLRMHLRSLHFAFAQSWKLKQTFRKTKPPRMLHVHSKRRIKGKLTSLSVHRRLSSEKVCVWLFTPIFRGSTKLLESQLTKPPCRGRQRRLNPVQQETSFQNWWKTKHSHLCPLWSRTAVRFHPWWSWAERWSGTGG